MIYIPVNEANALLYKRMNSWWWWCILTDKRFDISSNIFFFFYFFRRPQLFQINPTWFARLFTKWGEVICSCIRRKRTCHNYIHMQENVEKEASKFWPLSYCSYNCRSPRNTNTRTQFRRTFPWQQKLSPKWRPYWMKRQGVRCEMTYLFTPIALQLLCRVGVCPPRYLPQSWAWGIYLEKRKEKTSILKTFTHTT